MRRIELLRSARKMHVVFVAHACIKPFTNPGGLSFDKYELKLQKKASAFVKEWVDDVLFAAFDNTTICIGKNKGRATGGNYRIINTERTAAFDAKNRYDLPKQIPIS